MVGIGDSENDHALFQISELAVAVGSAVSTLRDAADWVTRQGNGNGTAEVLSALVNDDLAEQSERLTRHHIVLGSSADGTDIAIPPIGENLLITGTSGSGKSTLAHGILERLTDRGYQVCVIDPEGDYESVEKTIVFGNAQRGPTVSEILPHSTIRRHRSLSISWVYRWRTARRSFWRFCPVFKSGDHSPASSPHSCG